VTPATLERLILLAGIAQLGILVASAMVPFQMKWRTELSVLSRLHRQMYWVYGGYVVLSIIAFALISIVNARELAGGSALARSVSFYIAVFWGVRVALQGVFDARDHLTAWWLRTGYHLLTVVFVLLTVLYGWTAIHS
jgi:hypothetical protein